MSMTVAGLRASASFTETAANETPQLLDADVAFSASGSLAGGRLTLGGLLAEDRVSILSQGSAAGQIGFDGTTVSYGGIAIGTATGGAGTAFTVTFNGAVTAAAVEVLIERLSYANVSDVPTLTRTLTLEVVDAAGGQATGPMPRFIRLTGPADPVSGIDVGFLSAPAFVDLDGDGDLDLVSGELYGSFLAWQNTGSGFAPLTGSANPFGGFNVGNMSTPAFLDLDGDGDLDLVSGESDGRLLAWQNTGSGFVALTDSANPFDGFDAGYNSIPAVADLDGDGRLDLLVGANDGTIRALRNTGIGFTALTGADNPFAGISLGDDSAPTLVDLDGDGRLDLVAGNILGRLQAWQNTGSGFTALTGTANPFDGIDVGFNSRPTFVDLDGDGRLDLVSGAGDGSLLAWRNTGVLPTITVTVTPQNDAPTITSAAAASFAENGTGFAYQPAATDPDGTTSFTWSISGADSARFNINSATGAVSFRTAPNFEAPADAGGDNIYDIVVGASDGTTAVLKAVAITVTDVAEKPTLTGFGPSVTVAENTVNATPQLLDADVVFIPGYSMAGGSLVVGGLLAEDRISILSQGSAAGQIGFDGTTVSYGGIAIGTASGGVGGDFTVTFNGAVTGAAVEALIERLSYANVSDTPTATRALTLNVVDAAGASLGTPQITALTGPFDPSSIVTFLLYAAPAFADLNNDGRLDLVSGQFFGGLSTWLNTPSGFLGDGDSGRFFGINVGSVSSPAFVDLDGDGRLDLVLGDGSGQLTAFRNDGSRFNQLSDSANPFNGIDVGYASRPTFVDLDGDGRLDLVVGAGDGELRCWRNTGSGFVQLTNSANPFNGFDVGTYSAPAFADLDGDGDLDLVSGSYTNGLLAWRNDGGGFVALTDAANPFAGMPSLIMTTPTFGDVDGDGRLELFVGEQNGSLLGWWNTMALPTITVAVTAQNDAPVITSAATASFVENVTGIAYQGAATDPDGTTSFTWSLSGTDAALFTINAAIGAVSFRAAPDFAAPADAGRNNTYDIIIGASDGTTTTTRAVAITVTDAPEKPTLTGFAPGVTFAENTVNATPQLLDTDLVFVADYSLAGGRLMVGGLLAEDRVSILPQGSAAGQIGFDGTTVSYGGMAIGTATGGTGNTFTVTFNGAATGPAVDALIERLSYANVSDTPTATRTLTLNVVDAARASLGTPQITALTGPFDPSSITTFLLYAAPAFADLNNDGRLDLVSGQLLAGLSTWLNTPSGFLGDVTSGRFFGINVGDASSPAFVDLDGDGRLDLVLGDAGGQLTAFRNDGSRFNQLSGSANPFNGIDVGNLSRPTFVDLDGDGRLDLVVGAGDGELRSWRNTGSGFVQLTNSANPFNGIDAGTYSAPAIADLDGDGDLDLVSGSYSNGLLAWRNDGGGFVALTGAANPFAGMPSLIMTTPAFGDVDGDGRLELFVGEQNGSLLGWRSSPVLPTITVTVTAQNDAPVITSAATASVAENATGIAYQGAATDLEGTTSFTWSLSGTDAALFTINSATGAVSFRSAPNVEAPADAGRDNTYDIIIGASDGTTIGTRAVAITVTDVAEKPTLTGFGPGVTFNENTVNAAPRLLDASVVFTPGFSMAGGRLEVSGLLAEDRVSILSQGSAAGQIALAGTTVSYGGVAIGTASGGVGGTFTVTFNGAATGAAVDALIERLSYANVSDAPTETRTLTLNVVNAESYDLPPPQFVPFTAEPDPADVVTISASAPAFLDLDGDGRLDLVSGIFWNMLEAWRNTGSGFTRLDGAANPFFHVSVGLLSAPAFEDLDGDGRRDLVVGDFDGALRTWRNTASGFVEWTGTANPFDGITGGNNSKPAFADLNGDGHRDLVLGWSDGTLSVWRNTGSGFVELTGAANPFDAIDVGSECTPTFVDLDGDGDLDLVSGNFSGELLAWRNDDGNFVALTGGASPFAGFDVGDQSAPAFVDLDDDGRLDLVSGNYEGGFKAWRNILEPATNTITVTITPQNDAPTGPRVVTLSALTENTSRTITTADLLAGWTDGDGDAFTAGNLAVLSARPGTLVDNGDGSWTFTPAADDDSSVVFVFDVSDGESSRSGTATLDLLPENQAPTGPASITLPSIIEDMAVTLTAASLLAGWTDIDSAVLTVRNLAASAGTITDNLNGSWTFQPAANANGAVTFTYLVSDGAASVAASASLSIIPVNDAPTGGVSLSVAGSQLAVTNTLADGDGLGTVAYGWQASANGIGWLPIAGSSGDSFTPGLAEAGLLVRVVAGYTDGGGTAEQVASTTVARIGGAGRDVLAAGSGISALFGLDGNDSLSGSMAHDSLVGGEGNDWLDGGVGADTMTGGAGNDAYVVDDSGDAVVEAADGGIDRVNAAISYVLGATLELLTLTGTANINGTGNALANVLVGNTGANILDAGGANDGLYGLAGTDTLLGGEGNDSLDGGAGADSMMGGAGNDNYVVDDIGDEVVEAADGGIDRVNASISYALGATLELLTLAGTANINGTGNALANVLVGNTGANILDAGGANDGLYGLAGADTLLGGDGNDWLDGGVGADSMMGGAGNDNYVVDDIGDEVVEAADGGIDRVNAAFSYALGATLELLTLTGTANINGTGNALANVLVGNTGANILDGGGANDGLYGLAGADTLLGGEGNDWLDGGVGADSMMGGAGNDNYVVDDIGDEVVEAADGGIDRVNAAFSYALGATLELLTLTGTANTNGTGNALANVLVGNAGANILDGGGANDSLYGLAGADTLLGGDGNDSLDGGVGADSMIGGAGSDNYVVDDIGDEVVEAADGGIDRVNAAFSYALGATLELLTLTGTANINGIGNALANVLVGNTGANILDAGGANDSLHGLAGADTLLGGDGNDSLDGGVGADSMMGGAGSDNYVVDDIGDEVIEAADGGIDRVNASISYALGATLELLTLTGTANINGTGNALANTLVGNTGANILDAGGANDSLHGLAGADTLLGGDGNDWLDGGAGADSVAGGTGDDTFRFVRGEAQGDLVVDFAGNGSAAGDRLEFRGYGTSAQGARFTQVDATTWLLASADGTTQETIQFTNAATLHQSDWIFV